MPDIRDLGLGEMPVTGFIFKHSTRCPVSASAAERVRAFDWPATLYWVDVVGRGDVSDWVAHTLNIRHESPQLIRLEGGDVTGTWSHGSIQPERIL